MRPRTAALTVLTLAIAGLAVPAVAHAAPAPKTVAVQAATTTTGPGINVRVNGVTHHLGAYIISGHLLYCTQVGAQ